MSTLQLMLIITLNVFIVCFTFLRARSKTIEFHREIEKRIRDDKADEEYSKIESTLPKSPYGVSREILNQKWGYCITKDGNVICRDNYAQFFHTIELAVAAINQLERVEGYKRTRV